MNVQFPVRVDFCLLESVQLIVSAVLEFPLSVSVKYAVLAPKFHAELTIGVVMVGLLSVGDVNVEDHTLSPLQNVEDVAPEPELSLVTGRFPVIFEIFNDVSRVVTRLPYVSFLSVPVTAIVVSEISTIGKKSPVTGIVSAVNDVIFVPILN